MGNTFHVTLVGLFGRHRQLAHIASRLCSMQYYRILQRKNEARVLSHLSERRSIRFSYEKTQNTN
jgi:hypothetical protein